MQYFRSPFTQRLHVNTGIKIRQDRFGLLHQAGRTIGYQDKFGTHDFTCRRVETPLHLTSRPEIKVEPIKPIRIDPPVLPKVEFKLPEPPKPVRIDYDALYPWKKSKKYWWEKP